MRIGGRRSVQGVGLLLCLGVLGLGASAGSAASSTTTTFTAVADAYVVGGTTNQNNGTATTLRIKPSFPAETSYLNFNVSGLTGAVQSATLRVYALSGMNWGFDAYTTGSSWTETGLTAQNAPATATNVGSFPNGALTGWISLDVTPTVTANGTYSFALVGTYWQEISLAARESGANAPQLVITTGGASPPPDTQPPTAPGNLAVTNTSATSLTLGWTAATDDTAVTGYNLYNGADQGRDRRLAFVRLHRPRLRLHLHARSGGLRRGREHLPASDTRCLDGRLRRHPSTHRTQQPDRHEHDRHFAHPRLDRRHRQHRRHRLQPLQRRDQGRDRRLAFVRLHRPRLRLHLHARSRGLRRSR